MKTNAEGIRRRIARFVHTLFLTIAIAIFSHGAIADKININTADAQTLQTIPGIGPSKSEKIIEAREKLGEFSSMEELLQISGIGEKLLEKLKEHSTVSIAEEVSQDNNN